MASPHRKAFSRLETDAELTARVRKVRAGSYPWSTESVDMFAARYGLERRVVWFDD